MIQVGPKEYDCGTYSDLTQVPALTIDEGAYAYVADEDDLYRMSSEHVWKKVGEAAE